MTTSIIVVSALLKILFVIGVAVGVYGPVLVWIERRQSAMIQDRVGPHRAGIRIFGKEITLFGLLHPLADTIKMLWKEDFIPPKADKLMHSIAPIIPLIPAVASFAIVPFADTLYLDHVGNVIRDKSIISGPQIPMQVASLNVGILFAFALAGTGVVGAAIGGYSSNNKFSLLGGLRAASQMVSYEVALGLTLVGCFMVYGSLRLEDMATWQHEHVWGILVQPFGFILYLIAAIAETKRIPFDVPEGESELVGGYFTEYSGMKFGMFMMGEFVEIVLLSTFACTIFFGGWDIPFLYSYGFDVFGAVLELPHWAVIAIQVVGFLVKVTLFIWFQFMIRWSLPRFRYDQIMALCWKYLLPLSLVNILVTGAVIMALQ